jgi:hypothetical protein
VHLLVHEPRATVANLNQQTVDRVAMQTGHPLRAAEVAPDRAADDLDPTGRTERGSSRHPLLNWHDVLQIDIHNKKIALYCMAF